MTDSRPPPEIPDFDVTTDFQHEDTLYEGHRFPQGRYSPDTRLYDRLGVDRDASVREIEQAYKKRSLQHHPDLHVGSHHSDVQSNLNESHDILRDPVRRTVYDLLGETTDTASPELDSALPLALFEERDSRDLLANYLRERRFAMRHHFDTLLTNSTSHAQISCVRLPVTFLPFLTGLVSTSSFSFPLAPFVVARVSQSMGLGLVDGGHFHIDRNLNLKWYRHKNSSDGPKSLFSRDSSYFGADIEWAPQAMILALSHQFVISDPKQLNGTFANVWPSDTVIRLGVSGHVWPRFQFLGPEIRITRNIGPRDSIGFGFVFPWMRRAWWVSYKRQLGYSGISLDCTLTGLGASQQKLSAELTSGGGGWRLSGSVDRYEDSQNGGIGSFSLSGKLLYLWQPATVSTEKEKKQSERGKNRFAKSQVIRNVFGLGVGFDLASGWALHMHAQRQQHSLSVPLYCESFSSLLQALLIVGGSFWAIRDIVRRFGSSKKMILKREEREKNWREVEETREEWRRDYQKMCQEEEGDPAPRSGSSRLVITQALYGRKFGESQYPMWINVTIPIRRLVRNDQLRLQGPFGHHSGFFDPCPNKPKTLRIEFEYDGREGSLESRDDGLIVLPEKYPIGHL